MGTRATRKAGIQKPRLLKADNPQQLQRALDAIIERLEVLDGIRGDSLDRAVTYRDLGNVSGFGISTGGGSGGIPIIDTTPGPPSGEGIGVGPAAAPSNLVATETFLAILLTWDNPSFNLQHIEIWRSATDNLSTATLVGTTVSPQYLDYVGAEASYYYWVRSVGTDGTFSAYNDTAGTLGTTGVDPSEFEPNISISTSNLDAALSARIDLIDDPTTGLVDRTAALEGDVVTAQSDITALQSQQTINTGDISTQGSAISANASSISSQGTTIATIQSDLSTAQDNIADNTSSITVNANNILALQSSIGAIDSSGGQEWLFDSDLEGFTVANATLTGPTDGAAVFTPTASNPQLISETISIAGSVYTQVVVRLRQTIGGGTWEGNVYYTTPGHGTSAAYVKTIPDPSLSLSEWTVLTWDMNDLTVGGSDWVDSTIESIRLDLVSDNGGKFEIDYVLIAKFSTQALSDAIDALDVRVTANESSISSQATSITSLESTVNDPSTGVSANAAAISGLTTDVSSNTAGVSSNSSAIIALQNTVNDPTDGVSANASAIDTLQTDVSIIDGLTTAQAASITQLVASVDGGSASIVNTLETADEAYGTDFDDSDILQTTLGGRTFVGARNSTNVNVFRAVRRGSTNQRIYIEPNALYEVRFSLYHDRPLSDAGSWNYYVSAWDAATGGTNGQISTIVDGAISSTGVNIPVFASQNTAGHANRWFDVKFHILGADIDPTRCPKSEINGEQTNVEGFATKRAGSQVNTGFDWIELNFVNRNSSPTYGDDNNTTLWITDLAVSRIDTSGALHAAISAESTVRASETGDLNALYAVKVELSTNNDPYITGFGLASDVIGGVASSSFGIQADQFYITSPTYGTAPGAGPGDNENSKFPFVIDLVDGVSQVAIDGELIVDGTIRANAIVAASIGADKLNVNELSAVSGDMGTLTAGLIRTAASPAYRVELQDSASTSWPIWYGAGSKSAANGRFYVDLSGNVVVKGLLDAGMIKQTYFTPADATNDPFKIACDYPSNYSGGIYTGKKAALNPKWTTGYNTNINVGTLPTNGEKVDGANKFDTSNAWTSTQGRFYSPTNTSSVEWRRLGTLDEILIATFGAHFGTTNDGYWHAMAVLEYRYDSSATWLVAGYAHGVSGFRTSNVTVGGAYTFATRNSAFSTLDFRLKCWGYGNSINVYLQNAHLTVEGANMGSSDIDAGNITDITGSTGISTVNSTDFDGKIYRLV